VSNSIVPWTLANERRASHTAPDALRSRRTELMRIEEKLDELFGEDDDDGEEEADA
jgi:hypothetical protein